MPKWVMSEEPGLKITEADLGFSPRPNIFPTVRQFLFRFGGNYMTDQHQNMLEAEFGPMFGIRFQNSARIYLGTQRQQEYVDEDWEVRPGFIVPMDTYQGWNSFLWITSNESKNVSGGFRSNYGDYYTGKRLSLGPEILVTTTNRLRAEFNFDMNYVSLPEGDFTAQTFGCRIFYYFSTKLYIKAYIQLNDDRLANEGDSVTLANLLLRWTYRPGSDFYIVYNDRRLFGASAGQIANRTLMAKATFFWRK